MTALITKALSSGFTTNQVVKMLIKQFPQYKEQIEKALALGYGADKIIQHITKDKKGQPTISNEFLTESERQSKLERENKGFRNKVAGATALAAGAAAATALMPGAAQAAMGGIQGMLGGGQPQGPSPTPSPMDQTPGQTVGAQVQAPGTIPNVPIPPIGQQQLPTPQAPQIDSQKIIKEMGLEGQIKNLQKAGNDSEAIAAGVEASMRPEQKKWLQSQTQAPVSEIIKDYLTKSPQEISKEPAELKVGSEVITPDGDIANIEDLPGKTVKTTSNGRKNVYETEDLIAVPENKDEILSIYDKLIQAIPESARSTMVSAIGYDPKNNKAQVKFHDGTSYVYEDIDQEDIDSILNLENLAKTTGGNYFGVHFEGEPSLGAGMSKLIKRLQEKYGGKGKEYSGKFKEVYSLYAIPEGKRREREKAEREAKKKAKRPS